MVEVRARARDALCADIDNETVGKYLGMSKAALRSRFKGVASCSVLELARLAELFECKSGV